MVEGTGFEKVPSSLEASLNLLEKSQWAKGALGDGVVGSFVAMKKKECEAHASHLCSWEQEFYVDC